jgi:molybdopterin/thiamine biosynthesis adenylyltransferase
MDRQQLSIPAPYGRSLWTVVRAMEQGSAADDAWNLVDSELWDELEGYIESLLEQGYVRHPEKTSRAPLGASDRFDRQVRYFAQTTGDGPSVQRMIGDSSVVLVGLGGVGGPVAEMLVRLGIGRLVAVDMDDVAVENLPRQRLFTPADVGQPKADVAERRLRQIDPRADVTCRRQYIGAADDLVSIVRSERPDIVVVAADNPPVSIKQWSDEACFTMDVPCLMGGHRPPHVFVGPFVQPGATACFHCFMWADINDDDPELLEELDSFRDRKDYVVPAVGFADEIAANMMVSDVCGYLTGLWTPAALGRQLALDFRTFEQSWMYAGRSSCERCDRTAPLEEAA